MKINNYIIIVSLKNELACKLINRIPGLNIWRMQYALSKHCLVNLISKDTHLMLSMYSKTCVKQPETKNWFSFLFIA